MRKYLLTGLMATTLGVLSIGMIGCDRTLHEDSKTTTSPNGEQTTTDQKTVQHSDGSVTTEKQTDHNPPTNANGQ